MEISCGGYCVGVVAGGILLYILLSILAYSGLFQRIRIRHQRNPVGKLRVAYLYNTGPYKDCGPLFDRVIKLAPNQRCMGIYYDDPKTTPGNELRYIVATILSEDDSPIDQDVQERIDDSGLGLIEFPAIREAIGTTFPFPWMISVLIAVWRVYPALEKAIQINNYTNVGPSIEIYQDATIRFVMPLNDHDAFFVPEAKSQKTKST